MKRTEIILRQDRIVYTLLIMTAALGLAWVLWRHHYLLTHNGPAAAGGPAPTSARR
jgi:hypothetical protein